MSKFTKRLTKALRTEIANSIMEAVYTPKKIEEAVASFSKWGYEVFYKQYVASKIPDGVTLSTGLIKTSVYLPLPDLLLSNKGKLEHYAGCTGYYDRDVVVNSIRYNLRSALSSAHFPIVALTRGYSRNSEGVKLPFPSKIPMDMFNFYAVTLTEAAKEEILSGFHEAIAPVEALAKEYSEAYTDAMNILNSVNTFKRAAEVWPEIEPFLSRIHGTATKSTALVPYGAIRSLTQRLGLKSIN